MKKKLLSLGLILALIFTSMVLTGCGGSDGGSDGASNDNTVYTIKWAHGASTEFFEAKAIEEIADEIEEASNGRLVIQHYPSGQLGDEAEIFEGCQMGTIEMCTISTGALSGYWAPVLALCTPFIMTKEEGRELLDGSVGDYLAEEIEAATGVKCLGWAENGVRNFTSAKKQIVHPEDLKGMRIRTQSNFVTIGMVEACGANASPIAFGELYTALSQGAVDGQENPIAHIYSQKFYEVQDYVTIDEHMYDALGVFINPDFYASLPEDLQAILDEYAGTKYVEREREIADEDEAQQLEEIKASGTVVYTLTDEERQEWIDATAGIIDEVRKQCGDEIVDKINDGLASIREGNYK